MDPYTEQSEHTAARIRRRRMLAAYRGAPEPIETPLALAERSRVMTTLAGYASGRIRATPGKALRVKS